MPQQIILNYRSGYGAIMCARVALASTVFFFGQSLAEDLSTTQQRAFASVVNSSDIKAQADIQQRSANAIASSSITQPRSNGTITTGPQVEAEINRQGSANRSVIEATSAQAISKVKESLPHFNELGLNLRFGDASTVSPEGKAVVTDIRQLAKASIREQAPIIRRISALSSQGTPEAAHFLGFLHETGMFNTRQSFTTAFQFYEQAAKNGYGPSLYNMALMHAYGRVPPADLQRAIQLLGRAQASTKDASGRICGMHSFLAFRASDFNRAALAAQNCNSPLANLARAQDTKQPMQQRVTWLRDSLATGVDDAFEVLVTILRPGSKNDPSANFCKYALVSRHFYKPLPQGLQTEAAQCVDFIEKDQGGLAGYAALKTQLVAGVSGFVPAEISELKRMRATSRLHHSWPVPYLPFAGQDIELFSANYKAQGYK